MVTAATNIDTLFAGIESELNQVRDFIRLQLKIDNSLLEPFIEFLNAQNGKMIRPALVLLSGKAVGQITDIHIRIAAIVEMLHNATLLHDDVLDRAKRRRGKVAANKLWGNATAVLTGDLLLSNVFTCCAKLGRPRIVTILAEVTKKICLGEMLQNAQRQNFDLTEAEYIDIITAKTAVLFSTCCRLGALACNADDNETKALAEFGLNTGIAFQINDDLLDIIGTETKTGKTLGTDIERNTPTLPVIHLLKTVGDKRKIQLTERLVEKSITIAELAALMQDAGSFAYAQNLAETYCRKAIDALATIENSPSKTTLIELVRLLTA